MNEQGLFQVCEACPNEPLRRKFESVNEHIDEMPSHCLVLAHQLLELANCKRPRTEITLEDDVVIVERRCNNIYGHDIFRVLRAGEIIRSHQAADPGPEQAK